MYCCSPSCSGRLSVFYQTPRTISTFINTKTISCIAGRHRGRFIVVTPECYCNNRVDPTFIVELVLKFEPHVGRTF